MNLFLNIIPIIWLFGTSFVSGLKVLPNIDYVGRGYDIFRSVPRPASGEVDPGYVGQVVLMKANGNATKTSGDGRYIIPEASQVFDCLSCRFTLDVQTIQDTYEYAKTYEDKVEKGNSVSFTSGQASSDFGNVAHTTSADQRTLVDASLSCIVYCADLPMYTLKAKHLNKAYVEGVKNINMSIPETINEFLHEFGTHIVYSTRMGSLFWQRSTYSKLDWPKAVSSVNDRIKRAMEIEMADGWTDMTPDEVEMAKTFKSYATERFAYQIGAPFSPNRTWISQTRDSPMPIALSVVPISELMRKRVFPDDEEIDAKRQLVNDYITNGTYCNYLYEKAGMTGSCITDNALLPGEISRFVANPDSIDTCSGGSRLPSFGGVFVDGIFPNVPNYKNSRYECSPSHKYLENQAVVIQENGNTKARVIYCALGNDDQEGLFGGINSETFYIGECGTSNGGSRYYAPFPPDLVQFSRHSLAVFNPYIGSSKKDCPKHFIRHPLASLTVDEKRLSNGKSCKQAVNVFACFNPIEYYDGAFLGGFYTVWDSDKYKKIANPITKDANCKFYANFNIVFFIIFVIAIHHLQVLLDMFHNF